MTSVADNSVRALVEEHAGLEARLADPDVHADQALARRLGRRYAELAPIVATAGELERTEALSPKTNFKTRLHFLDDNIGIRQCEHSKHVDDTAALLFGYVGLHTVHVP